MEIHKTWVLTCRYKGGESFDIPVLADDLSKAERAIALGALTEYSAIKEPGAYVFAWLNLSKLSLQKRIEREPSQAESADALLVTLGITRSEEQRCKVRATQLARDVFQRLPVRGPMVRTRMSRKKLTAILLQLVLNNKTWPSDLIPPLTRQHKPDVTAGGTTTAAPVREQSTPTKPKTLPSSAGGRPPLKVINERSAPMSKTELAKRILNRPDARPRDIAWERFDLQQPEEKKRRYTVNLVSVGVDDAMRARLENPLYRKK